MKKLSIVFVAALGLSVANTGEAHSMACADDSGLCVDGGGAKWQSDKSASKKQRKKRSAKRGGTISMEVDGGRGSLFINGRYAGTAPLSGAKIPAGANDIQVRDGAKVLAKGLLTVPRTADVSITVNGA
ncbi:MAG: hypothetical protein AAF721_26540 [Myxococcota bacterium]